MLVENKTKENYSMLFVRYLICGRIFQRDVCRLCSPLFRRGILLLVRAGWALVAVPSLLVLWGRDVSILWFLHLKLSNNQSIDQCVAVPPPSSCSGAGMYPSSGSSTYINQLINQLINVLLFPPSSCSGAGMYPSSGYSTYINQLIN